MLSHFCLTVTDSHLAFSLFKSGNKVFLFVIWSMSSKYLLKWIKLFSYSYWFWLLTFLLASEDQSYCKALTENTILEGKYALQFKVSFIHFLFMNT